MKSSSILIILLLLGCAARTANLEIPQTKSVTKSEEGVTVSVKPPAGNGDIESYITPFYVEMQNNSGKLITINYTDIVLFDANRTQYNALAPQTAASLVQSARQGENRSYSPVSVGVGGGFGTGGGGFFSLGTFFDLFGIFRGNRTEPVRTEEIFTQSLNPGDISPDAILGGFVYFKRVPPESNKSVTFEISYQIEGEDTSRTISFPFNAKDG